MKYSVVIPAHNEQSCIESTVRSLCSVLDNGGYEYEILVVADHCTDDTERILTELQQSCRRLRWRRNSGRPGYGMAVREGLDHFTGEAVAIYMADASDSPEDLCLYFDRVASGAECVFGSRFVAGGKVIDYPRHKLVLNRLANLLVRMLFCHGYNDTTNAFKCYRREVIEGCQPLLSRHFNLTIEIPLKAVIRGYSFEVVPISWRNRTSGVSKLRIKEMGSRYFFILMYCLLEKWLTGSDYSR